MHKNLRQVLTGEKLPWRDELAQILAHFNRKHAIKDKDVSHKTREDREDFYFAFFRELRGNADVKMKGPRRNLPLRTFGFWAGGGARGGWSRARSRSPCRT